MIWTPRPTSSAATSAPKNKLAGARPKRMIATATPGRSECAIASAIRASRRKTMKALSAPLVNPISAQPKRARSMNSWRKGSVSQRMSVAGSVAMRVSVRENLGAISARDVFFVENFAGVAKRDQLSVEENHLIEKFRHRPQIVVGRDDEISGRDKFAN